MALPLNLRQIRTERTAPLKKKIIGMTERIGLKKSYGNKSNFYLEKIQNASYHKISTLSKKNLFGKTQFKIDAPELKK